MTLSVTLCFPVDANHVLLGLKQTSYGKGLWNGFGGKAEADEAIKTTAVRELREESGLVAREQDLLNFALLHVSFCSVPRFECHVYLIRQWSGTPIPTTEMIPQWFPCDQLPLTQMWAGDALWLPLVLAGATLEAWLDYEADGSTIRHFSYRTVLFED